MKEGYSGHNLDREGVLGLTKGLGRVCKAYLSVWQWTLSLCLTPPPTSSVSYETKVPRAFPGPLHPNTSRSHRRDWKISKLYGKKQRRQSTSQQGSLQIPSHSNAVSPLLLALGCLHRLSAPGSRRSPNAVFRRVHGKAGQAGRPQVSTSGQGRHEKQEQWRIGPLGAGTRGNDGKRESTGQAPAEQWQHEGLSSPPACRPAVRKAAASSPSSWSGLELCSHSPQWRSSWEGRSGPCRSNRSRGAGWPATPTWWYRRGPYRCTWTAGAPAGCGWCSGQSSRRFPLASRSEATRNDLL